MDALRFGQPAEAMGAEVDEFDVRRQPLGQQIDGGLRQHELTAVRGRRQSGAPVDGGAEVVVVAYGRRAGVHADSHLEREARSGFLECELHVQRRVDCLGSCLECRCEAVARGAEDVAVVAVDDRADAPVVFGERFGHRVGRLIPERGRSFDVGEHERDSARRRARW